MIFESFVYFESMVVIIEIVVYRYEDDADSVKPPSSPTFVGSTEGSSISANIVFRTLKGTLNLIGSKYSSSMSQKIATKAIVAFCKFMFMDSESIDRVERIISIVCCRYKRRFVMLLLHPHGQTLEHF